MGLCIGAAFSHICRPRRLRVRLVARGGLPVMEGRRTAVWVAAGCTVGFVAGVVAARIESRRAIRALRRQRHRGDEHADDPPRASRRAKAAKPDADTPVPSTALKHLNFFLRQECAPTLLEMGLLTNVHDVAEAMACLHAVDKHLPNIRFSDPDTLCVVVGDGQLPRTAVLAALRTKWGRVIVVDPALGYPGKVGHDASAAPAGYMCKDKQIEEKLAKSSKHFEAWKGVQRLEMLATTLEQAAIAVNAERDRHVVLLLPHAHVSPDAVLGSLRLSRAAVAAGRIPDIAVVQLPCCSYAKHKTVCGLPPDTEYVDVAICGSKHGSARAVRVWRDVAHEATRLQLTGTSEP